MGFSFLEINTIKSFPEEGHPLDNPLQLSDDQWDDYFEYLSHQKNPENKHQLFGYPKPIQGNEMEWECEMISNGFNTGTKEPFISKEGIKLKSTSKRWKFLLQFDTDESMGYSFGDGGSLFFWVPEEEAIHGNFENSLVLLQCY